MILIWWSGFCLMNIWNDLYEEVNPQNKNIDDVSIEVGNS